MEERKSFYFLASVMFLTLHFEQGALQMMSLLTAIDAAGVRVQTSQ